MIYLRKNNFNNALGFFNKSAALSHDQADIHHKLGVIYEEKEEFTKARKEYKIAINVDPKYEPARNRLLELLKKNKR